MSYKLTWRAEALLSVMAFGLAYTESCFGWLIAGMLWLSWALHDRKKEFEEAIERMRNEP